MSYKKLHDLKIDRTQKKELHFVEYLFVVENIFSLAAYYNLVKKLGPDKVSLLLEKTSDLDDIIPTAPGTLRGHHNIEHLSFLYPDVVLTPLLSESCFLKEGQLRKFSSRFRPEKLLYGEKFFRENRAKFNYQDIFPFLNDAEFLKKCKERALIHPLASIDKQDDRYILETNDGNTYKVETLYWGKSEASFLDLFKNKKKLNNDFIQFCEECKTPSSLVLKFIFDEVVSELAETVFIPLSYTHDWGHFIGEFELLDSNRQELRLVSFIDPLHTNEEDISRKIKSLKRNLEKVIPQFSSMKYKEYYFLQGDSFCEQVNDTLAGRLFIDDHALHFLGLNPPLDNLNKVHGKEFDYSSKDLSYAARAIEGIYQKTLN